MTDRFVVFELESAEKREDAVTAVREVPLKNTGTDALPTLLVPKRLACEIVCVCVP